MKGLQYTFTSGEISPEAYGRVDLPALRTGLATCKNFTILPHGPAPRRPGFRFKGQAFKSDTPVRIVPFVGSAGGSPSSVLDYSTAILIEMGDLYVRFWANGAHIHDDVAATTVTGITGGDTFEGTIPVGWADGDWVTLTGTPEAGLTPLLDQTYKLTDVVTGPGGSFKLEHNPVSVAVDASAAPAAPVLLQARRVYTLVSPFAAADLFTLRYTQSPEFLTFTHGLYATRELYRVTATTWAFRTTSFAPTLAAPAGLAAASTPASPPSSAVDHVYVVTAIATDLVTESLPSASVTEANDLTIAGNFNTVTWSAVGGASYYGVYKLRGGVFGLLGKTPLLTLADVDLLPDVAVTPPGSNLPALNTAPGEYPQAVTYYDQRRVFAGTLNAPDSVWATRNGTDSNLLSSVPAREDDALVFKVAGQQRNTIRHLVSLTDIIALTVGGAFRIFASGSGALSFSTVTVKPQGNAGASDVQPVMTPSSALYVQAQGSRVRELSYQAEGTGRYASDDVMLLAPHLVQDYGIVDLAYTYAPDQLAWAVRADGVLLGMTHVPEHDVYAWHRHDTQGFFESVATVPEGNRDVLYAVVKRATGGPGGKNTVRYIEQMTPRIWSNPLTLEDAFFLDSGITYDGADITEVDRLWHLEGTFVEGLADGAAVASVFVQNGTISLDGPAGVVHVGKAYTSDLQALPFNSSQLDANGLGQPKSIRQVDVLVKHSSGVQAGQSFDDLFETPDRTVSLPFGSPPPLFTGVLEIPVGLGWAEGGQVCIRQNRPLPCTVLSFAPAIELGD